MIFKNNLFKLTDAPIILGLLLAFVAWGTKHIVDRVTATPIIEYRMGWMDKKQYDEWKEKYKTDVLTCDSRDALESEDYNYLKIKIKNLSYSFLIKDISITFGFSPDSKSKIKASQLLSKAPAIKGDNVEICNENFVQIDTISFHPHWEYTLVLALEGGKMPYAVLSKSEQAISFAVDPARRTVFQGS